MKKIISWSNIFFVCALLLTACRGGTVSVGYQPPFIPVKVSIDSNGHLSVSWDGIFQTPLGTFSVGVAADPAQIFPNANGILTVRINGEDTIYDLDGKDVDIELDSGYYKQVTLRKNGQNWFLEATKIENLYPSNPTEKPITAPVPNQASSSTCDNFDNTALNAGWVWIDPKGDSAYSLTDNPGVLRLTVYGRNHDLYQNLNAPRMLQHVNGDFTVTTKVTINPRRNYQAAGLLYWQDENNYVRLERTLVKGIDLLYKIQGEYKAIEIPFSASTVFLKFELSNQTIQASYSDDSYNWSNAGTLQLLSTGNAQLGIDVVNEWQDDPISADFDYFKFSQCQ